MHLPARLIPQSTPCTVKHARASLYAPRARGATLQPASRDTRTPRAHAPGNECMHWADERTRVNQGTQAQSRSRAPTCSHEDSGIDGRNGPVLL
eukprot:2124280-Pleurochrysis_carterae.AAC.1